MIKVKSKSFITQSIVQDGEKVCVMCSGSAKFGPQASGVKGTPTTPIFSTSKLTRSIF